MEDDRRHTPRHLADSMAAVAEGRACWVVRHKPACLAAIRRVPLEVRQAAYDARVARLDPPVFRRDVAFQAVILGLARWRWDRPPASDPSPGIVEGSDAPGGGRDGLNNPGF